MFPEQLPKFSRHPLPCHTARTPSHTSQARGSSAGCCSPSGLVSRGLCPLKGCAWPLPSPARHGCHEPSSLRASFYRLNQTVAIHATGPDRRTKSSVKGAQARLTRTAALHGAVGSRVAFGACDVTSPFVQIQTFLTFCAKVSTETGLTVLNFAFWGKKPQSHYVV